MFQQLTEDSLLQSSLCKHLHKKNNNNEKWYSILKVFCFRLLTACMKSKWRTECHFILSARISSFVYIWFPSFIRSVERMIIQKVIGTCEKAKTRKIERKTKLKTSDSRKKQNSKHPIWEKHRLFSFTQWETPYVTKIFTFTASRFIDERVLIVGCFSRYRY